ncbi:MAG TPA: hypothetical protein VGF28_08820 [Thermoanaerobaculia bacterium]
MTGLRRIASLLACLGAVLALVAAAPAPRGAGFVLAGESIAFDAGLRPRFSEHQVRATSLATRDGFALWSATAEGKAIIRRFHETEREVHVFESDSETGIGRAPQPGFATLLTAGDPTRRKRYDLILNPTLAGQYAKPSTLDLGLPRTPGDVMAVAWAGEMLHIDFYADGIPLPHHQRNDFQERWRAVANALGFPLVDHATDEGALFSGGHHPPPSQ